MDVVNDAGETIPCHAVVEVTGGAFYEGDSGDSQDYYLNVDQPSGEDALTYIAHNKSTLDGQLLKISRTYPQLALIDTAPTTPTAGDEWGPASGEWHLTDTGTGYLILHVLDETNGIALVSRLTGGCTAANCKMQLTVFGSPTGGTFDIDLLVDGTTDTLTFNYDDTAAEVKTELATHTNLTTAEIDTTGGDFPDATVEIEFKGDVAESSIPLPLLDWSSLTGGTGVGVIVSYSQIGHPNDGS